MFGPWKIDEGFWVAVAAYSVAAVCLIGVIVVGLRERRRTGRFHDDGSRGQGWFFLFALLFFGSNDISGATLRLWPFCVLFPALNMAFLVGFGAVAIRAFLFAFLDTWHWRTGLWITSRLIMSAAFAFSIYGNVVELHLPGWIWGLAGLLAAFLSPFFVRFAFEAETAGGQAEPDTSPQPDFRLWRPGDPG